MVVVCVLRTSRAVLIVRDGVFYVTAETTSWFVGVYPARLRFPRVIEHCPRLDITSKRRGPFTSTEIQSVLSATIR